MTSSSVSYAISGSSWVAKNLINGAIYQYKLQSVNGMINGATSAAVSVTPTGPAPSAPTNLRAVAADRAAVLTWTMPANATCVYVHTRNVSAGETGFTRLPYPVCDDSFTPELLVNGATYEYKVQAYNDLIAGGTSAVVSVVPRGAAPAGPENLTVTSGNNKAILNWNQASRATSYYIWYQQVAPTQGSWERLPYAISGSTFTARYLINGASYQYKVQSVDGLQPGDIPTPSLSPHWAPPRRHQAT